MPSNLHNTKFPHHQTNSKSENYKFYQQIKKKFTIWKLIYILVVQKFDSKTQIL